jgi:hypothetical protein
VRRNAALIVMIASELLVGLVILAFYLKARTAILAAFHDYGTDLPGTAAVALAPWFLPGALGFALVASLVGLAAPLRRTQRHFLVGAGLFVIACALIFAVWAAFLPLFQPA